jgi:ATP-dependent helicase HrpA
MAALDIGRIEAFPFLEPPPPRAVADGYQLLEELGAVERDRRLTPLGRELARLPVDARIGRMILEARTRGCRSTRASGAWCSPRASTAAWPRCW